MAYIFATTLSLPVYVPMFETVGEGKRHDQFFDALRTGETIDSEGLPKVERQKSRHKAIPDFFHGPAINYVSEPVKDLIESLEPNVHQFIEIKLLDRAGNPFEKRYFRFHIRQWFDSLIAEKSTLDWRTIPQSERYYWAISEPPSREHFTVDKSLVGDKHFWMDDKLGTRGRFCSDAFKEAFEATGYKYLKFQSVDEFW